MNKLFFYNCVAILALSIGCDLTASAQLSDTERLIQAGILQRENTYFYSSEGRPDPFKPFVSTQSASPVGPNPNEIIDENEVLTGMQLFEPGQLTLVGILLSPASVLAFVEDQAKKGYVLKVGTLIGKRGVVTQIESDQVIIEETAKTRSGQEIKSRVVMKLNKEGDR